MPQYSSDGAGYASECEWFATTHWSVVLSSGGKDSPQASEARERLCRTYWHPLYNYVRRQGWGPEDAEDLTQAFFAKLVEKNFWARADPQKGRFRSLMLTALRQFLADQRDRAMTAKRGGGVQPLSLDERTTEEAGAQEHDQDRQYDRQWAFMVLNQARAALRQEYLAAGKSPLYDGINLLDESREGARSHADIARQLGVSVGAVKSAAFRLRERYGELVREEVARTVSSPAEVDAEIQYLLSIIGS